jgi:hypothetical protein
VVDKTVSQTALEVAAMLQIGESFAVSLVQTALNRSGEFGRSLKDTVILLHFIHRRMFLQCLHDMILLAFDSDMPDMYHSVLSAFVSNWLHSGDGDGSLVQRLLTLLRQHKASIFSLLIEEKLGVDSAADHAMRQGIKVAKAYQRMKDDETENIWLAIGASLYEERTLISRILLLLAWNFTLPLHDVVALLKTCMSSDQDEPIISLLIACFIASLDLTYEVLVAQRTPGNVPTNNATSVDQLLTFCDKEMKGTWRDKSIHSVVQIQWTILLRKFSEKMPSLSKSIVLTQQHCEEQLELAVLDDAFVKLRIIMLPFVSLDTDSDFTEG